MVYELGRGMHGDVIVLSASSWQVEDTSGATRVTVSPAPGVAESQAAVLEGRRGQPADRAGDGHGRLHRRGRARSRPWRGRPGRGKSRLRELHDLGLAAENLLAYLEDEREATGALPTDKRVVIERFRDKLGDWRLTLLTPFGGQVHAPWSLALEARHQERLGMEVEDHLVGRRHHPIRLPEGDANLDGVEALLFPDADEVEDLVVGQLANSALFASRFRENAARALLARAGARGHARRSGSGASELADLLASRYGSFPILVETYHRVPVRRLRPAGPAQRPRQRGVARDRGPQRRDAEGEPFASSLLFDYVAAPTATRRWPSGGAAP